MRSFAVLAGLALLLAGCADNAPTEEEQDFDIDVEATETTGAIRGIIVDAAIVPVPGVTVTIENHGGTTTSNDKGEFGFSKLDPGFYQLTFEKPLWETTRSGVEVKAGVATPPIFKVQMAKDPTQRAYAQPYQFNGYIECSASTPAYRVAVCGAVNFVFELAGQPPPLDDAFIAEFEMPEANPDYLQGEMIWQSSQALGDHMLFITEYSASDGHEIFEPAGPSPLVGRANATVIMDSGAGPAAFFQQRVFNMEHPATTPPVPVCGIPNPVHGGYMCAKGVGLTLQQKFEIFTHVFYRFEPAPEWTFINDGPPQEPE